MQNNVKKKPKAESKTRLEIISEQWENVSKAPESKKISLISKTMMDQIIVPYFSESKRLNPEEIASIYSHALEKFMNLEEESKLQAFSLIINKNVELINKISTSDLEPKLLKVSYSTSINLDSLLKASIESFDKIWIQNEKLIPYFNDFKKHHPAEDSSILVSSAAINYTVESAKRIVANLWSLEDKKIKNIFKFDLLLKKPILLHWICEEFEGLHNIHYFNKLIHSQVDEDIINKIVLSWPSSNSNIANIHTLNHILKHPKIDKKQINSIFNILFKDISQLEDSFEIIKQLYEKNIVNSDNIFKDPYNLNSILQKEIEIFSASSLKKISSFHNKNPDLFDLDTLIADKIKDGIFNDISLESINKYILPTIEKQNENYKFQFLKNYFNEILKSNKVQYVPSFINLFNKCHISIENRQSIQNIISSSISFKNKNYPHFYSLINELTPEDQKEIQALHFYDHHFSSIGCLSENESSNIIQIAIEKRGSWNVIKKIIENHYKYEKEIFEFLLVKAVVWSKKHSTQVHVFSLEDGDSPLFEISNILTKHLFSQIINEREFNSITKNLIPYLAKQYFDSKLNECKNFKNMFIDEWINQYLPTQKCDWSLSAKKTIWNSFKIKKDRTPLQLILKMGSSDFIYNQHEKFPVVLDSSLRTSDISEFLIKAQNDVGTIQQFMSQKEHKPWNLEIKIHIETILLNYTTFIKIIDEISPSIDYENQSFLENNFGKFLLESLKSYDKAISAYEVKLNSAQSKIHHDSYKEIDAFKERIDLEALKQINILEKHLQSVKNNILEALDGESIRDMSIRTRFLKEKFKVSDDKIKPK